jgi:arylamine N-acetyltransferase
LDPACLETPAVLLSDHLEKGTGGTCYSMAYSLAALLESAGIDCYLTLNAISGQEENHAAVVAMVDGITWLCDPGVQLRVPVVFSPETATSADNGFCIVHIVPTDVPGDFNVSLQITVGGPTIPWFLFHSKPVDESAFRQVWLQSFTGPMMNTFHIFRHCDTRSRHLLYGFRIDKIPGKSAMKEPVTLQDLPRHVHEIWPEIPEGHMEAAWEALTARGASPVLRLEDCLKI